MKRTSILYSLASWGVAAAILMMALAPSLATAQKEKKGAAKKPNESDAAAGLIRYEIAGGESYFALSLRARSLPAAGAHDHVILVDTSASQAGAHRRQALAVLDACLATLDKSDRVRLFAFDVKVTPLADDFHPPQSAETKEAVARLKQIVPLGATALQPALESALKCFGGDRGRSVIYIGDGMSTAKLIPLPDLRDLLGRLRKARVPVNSFAVGPRTDLQLLGSVAVHTGGTVLVDALIDEAKISPEQVGQKLAAAAAAPVFYPEQITLSPEIDELLPEVVPPIRADRDAILLGKGRVAESLKVAVAGEGRSLDWTVKPAATQPGNTFLVGLWGLAERTEGLAVAVAGQELLEVARQEFEDNLVQLVALGKQAVAARNLKDAEQIADMIRQLDPANVEAQTILNAVQKAKAAAAALDREKEVKKPRAVKPTNSDLLEQERSSTGVRPERLKTEVLRTIDAARKAAKDDPEAALNELKRALTSVKSSTDIPADIRTELQSKLKAAIDDIEKAKKK